MTRWIHSTGSGAHLTASPRRSWTDRIVEAARPGLAYSDSADTAGLAASSATKVRGLHATVIGADRAVAVPSWLVERLQPELQVGKTRLTGGTATLHLQVSDPPVQVADVTLWTHATCPPHTGHAYGQVWHALCVQSAFQAVPRSGGRRLLLLLRLHSANLSRYN